ncbi:stage V sporulation protein T [Hominifimenecus microfluidus]|uniref:Stage V sporulation protein T n=1 Tax=Hominifimenecus microfluidus TaxID=2885348 RepID=A0AAE3ED40_9FIRM|nr:stage V sporulation protein T [Hominifimenecus microfluidus]MCC2232474.1 stage V sporulation protein T [Hominifimenecus microfluidus]
MKATGIVRRIDDLGRVVIPKEIRRTLRLREGTPLEIFTDREGEIIFKKYSPMAELGTFAAQYADALAAGSGHMVCITDRDQVLAVSGGMKKEVRQKGISEDLSRLLSRRETLTASRGDARFIPILAEENPEYLSETIVPILCEGDVIGSVILAGREEKSRMGETEKKLAATASGFLGKQMEN